MPLLRITDADGIHVHPLDDETVTIGRGPGNKIVLKDLASSSRHAQVVKDGAGWRLEDRGSLNGTFVNGTQVQKKPLVAGDRVQIGSTEIVFELSQTPPIPETRMTPPKSRGAFVARRYATSEPWVCKYVFAIDGEGRRRNGVDGRQSVDAVAGD